MSQKIPQLALFSRGWREFGRRNQRSIPYHTVAVDGKDGFTVMAQLGAMWVVNAAAQSSRIGFGLEEDGQRDVSGWLMNVTRNLRKTIALLKILLFRSPFRPSHEVSRARLGRSGV